MATWTAHGDYLSVLASTRTSCQPRHCGARVAPDTATRRIIGHRPQKRQYMRFTAPFRTSNTKSAGVSAALLRHDRRTVTRRRCSSRQSTSQSSPLRLWPVAIVPRLLFPLLAALVALPLLCLRALLRLRPLPLVAMRVNLMRVNLME